MKKNFLNFGNVLLVLMVSPAVMPSGLLGEEIGPVGMYYTFGNDADGPAAKLYRSLGVTSIESYVTWESCEGKGLDQWDWSKWDQQVQILQENGLKWVPFLILSPAYSTPGWFRAGPDHVPCRCLEHEIDSKIESLWNPNLPPWIDRFLAKFAQRYGKSGVIESVLLGIQGDFGEAIYSVSGGGWTFEIPGEYHNHQGFWCGDRFALADFRKYAAEKYQTAERINQVWGTSLAGIGEADFPGRKEKLAEFRQRLKAGNPQDRRYWLDFVDWYRESMTRWSDWWMATTRKHFPNTPIYLCTGGHAIAEHGSNFAEQCRVAARHQAGVRITNEGSDYKVNFGFTRWVASAGKFYGAYYGFEPAGPEDEWGIVARIYNATASGANQLHDYNSNVVQSEERKQSQQKHVKYLFRVENPMVPIALWYPNVSLTLEWGDFLERAMRLRDYTDFDYVDETMLRNGALARNKILLIIQGPVMETKDAEKIAEWLSAGGCAVVMEIPKMESVEGSAEPEQILFGGEPGGRTLGKGRIARVSGWGALAGAVRELLEELKLPVYDLQPDNIFGTQIAEDRFLFLNRNADEISMEIFQNDKRQILMLPGMTISDSKVIFP